MDYSLSGLASGFDWKTFVNSVMALQAAPVDRMNTEKTTNNSKNSALQNLDTRLTALQTSVTALGAADLFGARKAASSTGSSSWNSTAATGTAIGNYQIAVTKLATVAHRDGAVDLSRPLNATDDGIGLTLATLPTATAVTAGTFTVNGKKVTIALTDTLDQVFTAISAATGGAVTASYDHTTDKIKLDGGLNQVVLGAANDTSNFLAAMRLANNGTVTTSSTGTLGTLKPYSPLATAQLKADMTGLIAAGDSTFSINGVSISYNVNNDSLSTVLKRINQSGAGVTASYNSSSDRIILANNTTGDMGITVADDTGGLMAALGLTGGSALVRGQNAEFSINGGATLVSSSNTLDATAHGIAGLIVTVDTQDTQTISISGDTTSMRSAIEDFIAKFNDVQSYLDTATKVTSTDGKVTSAILSDNREIQSWGSSLRSMAFGAVSGLSGTINRLEGLGIDFTSGTSQLEIKDGTKLDTALRDKSADVAEFFQTATTGLASKMADYTSKLGTLNTQQEARLTKANTDLDRQIADLQRRLDQQRAILNSSFIAMETAQSKLQSQSAALTKAFSTTSTTTG